MVHFCLSPVKIAGSPVSFDTHGDPYDALKNFYHGYRKGRNEFGNQG
ncbi:protein of unknown function [Thauera humireducens]|jgi:hypothetical protein|nr:hypothetical protein [Thauera humireducens]CAH1745166.1 protein of unknown function [Thauera humireducens]